MLKDLHSRLSFVSKHARRRGLQAALAGAVVATTPFLTGCQRAFYRAQADHEAYCIIDEKVRDAGEQPPGPLRIELDRRSRMFNPFDQDRPPMPVDDPRSHKYMHQVDGRRAYPLWHANGQTNATQSPDWWQFLPLDENGVLVLDAEKSVELALLHSTDFQRQVETLYLAALDVSSERFQFDTQFFGGAQTSAAFFGEDASLRGAPSTQIGLGNRPIRMQRQFTTGANLVVGMANSIVWDLSKPTIETGSGLLDFSLVQPLLRRGGRDRVMERLTLAERRLLANIRTYERYRRSFFLNITTGRNTESGVSRSGGVFGVGLGGFTGLGSGFAGLGGGGGGIGGGGGVAQAGGFLGLLQDQLQIRNQEENVARLRENLLLLEDTLRLQLTTIPDDQEEIPRQRLQIAQARSALFSANSQLLQARTGFESSIDSFLTQLGLPPYLCVRLDDPLLKQFELISPTLNDRREEVTNLRFEVGEINTTILNLSTEKVDPGTGFPKRSLQATPELVETLKRLRQQTAPIADLQNRLLVDDLAEVAGDIERLRNSFAARQAQADRLAQVYETERDQICSLLPISSIDPELFELDGIAGLADDLTEDHKKLADKIAGFASRISDLESNLETLIIDVETAAVEQSSESNQGDDGDAPLTRRVLDEAILGSQSLLAEMADTILALQLLQARARTESVVLPEVDLTPAEAFEIAQENRRDLANARASLVDSWRLVEFNADDLESVLDFTMSGGVRNGDTSNPLDFRDSQGTLRMGLQWDAPITRLQERNTYRQALVEFQQARRSFYLAEDTIWRALRAQLRQLRANQINFELQRQAVRIAADQITLNEDIRQLRDARGLSSGPTAARDIIFALDDLLSAQNGFLNIWVNYEVIRRGLDLDLGTMELTSDGLWIDPGTITPATVGLRRSAAEGEMLESNLDGAGMIIESEVIGLGAESDAPFSNRPDDSSPEAAIATDVSVEAQSPRLASPANNSRRIQKAQPIDVDSLPNTALPTPLSSPRN